jgi:hypothetical protein
MKLCTWTNSANLHRYRRHHEADVPSVSQCRRDGATLESNLVSVGVAPTVGHSRGDAALVKTNFTLTLQSRADPTTAQSRAYAANQRYAPGRGRRPAHGDLPLRG